MDYRKRLGKQKYRQKISKKALKGASVSVHLKVYGEVYVATLTEDALSKIKEIIVQDTDYVTSAERDDRVYDTYKVIKDKDGMAVGVRDIGIGDYIKVEKSFYGHNVHCIEGDIYKVVRNFGDRIDILDNSGDVKWVAGEEIDHFMYLGDYKKAPIKKDEPQLDEITNVESRSGFSSGSLASESVDAAFASIGMYDY